MKRMEKYVQQALEQMQSPSDERKSLREELLSHLHEAKNKYISDGLSEKQAEERALDDFGNAYFIGRELQESMYPFQRGLLYAIGIATILFGVIFYLSSLINFNESLPVWLVIQLLSGTIVSLAAINISKVGSHFYLVNLIVFANVIWNGINLALTQSATQWQAILFSLYLVILVGMGLVFVFRNSYYSTDQVKHDQKNQLTIKLGYIVNLLYGVVIICLGLFYAWGFLAFVGVGWPVAMPFIPVVAWVIFYRYQMAYIAKKPLLSMGTGLLFSVASVVLTFSVFFIFA
ncbi:permease prefix domain 1-containing protein [Virgibacillus doumboii]|uniref:permease prefix domain 1-containing protein n=1 Tax=Virgibacillus doumboii TaxID=2697503 RepID=UPI0013DED977|nr:permease prefix domain 1-containing protein [Virgibacillus doumboii]